MNTSSTTNLTDRRDLLWRTLARYDIYVGTTIARAAAVAAVNALIVGVLSVKAPEALASITNNGPRMVLSTAMCASALAALGALTASFVAIVPYTGGSHNASLIYFGDVGRADVAEFLAAVQTSDSESIERDLARQVHAMAVGLRRKFGALRLATYSTILALVLASIVPMVLLANPERGCP